jgi:sugar phosphate isomerase/epimerase
MKTPGLAAFPKSFMQELCKTGSMKLEDWIKLASPLDIEGLEWYAGFLEMKEKRNWKAFRGMVEDSGKCIPMLCCSPDFTHPEKSFRDKEIEKQKEWIEMANQLGANYCRVLSGQRRPEIAVEEGISLSVECISSCIPFAKERNVRLIIENHYKDDFWEYPEFAQKMDIFCKLIDSITDPYFGVNYDPSNAWLAGDDPLELLKRVKHRVLTMHASDRYLVEGTLEDLRKEEEGIGYAKRLKHGEIGKGLNNYDAIFSELKTVGFEGWISIEDGVEGMGQLERSVGFLRQKIEKYWK